MSTFQKYRDAVLFIWGIVMLTAIILFHIVTDYEAYIILAAAIGLPLFVEIKRGKNGDGNSP